MRAAASAPAENGRRARAAVDTVPNQAADPETLRDNEGRQQGHAGCAGGHMGEDLAGVGTDRAAGGNRHIGIAVRELPVFAPTFGAAATAGRGRPLVQIADGRIGGPGAATGMRLIAQIFRQGANLSDGGPEMRWRGRNPVRHVGQLIRQRDLHIDPGTVLAEPAQDLRPYPLPVRAGDPSLFGMSKGGAPGPRRPGAGASRPGLHNSCFGRQPGRGEPPAHPLARRPPHDAPAGSERPGRSTWRLTAAPAC